MQQNINSIMLSMPLGMGNVNCYLIDSDDGHILIDTGSSNRRKELEIAIGRLGCRPGLLKLIILTHGDFDHIGNAAYLRAKLGGEICMHQDDLAMAEQGDMFANRKKPNVVVRKMVPLFLGFGKAQRFSPDFFLADGDNLSEYGFNGRIVTIPGHSKGSIGILTAEGSMFCGDLFENTKEPALNSIMDDPMAAAESIRRLEHLGVETVYPGHGDPFRIDQFLTERI